jgi:hypothetical protein
MRMMLIAGLALSTGAFVAPAGHAATPDTIKGGCFFNTVQVTTAGGYVGYIGDVSVTRDGSGLPTGATVSCWLAVNGVEAPGTRHTYGDMSSPVQAGIDLTSYTISPYDDVAECEYVVYADNTTSSTDCPPIDTIEIPPQKVRDLLVAIERIAQGAICADGPADVCAIVCPQLQTLAGDYGPLTITPDGDVVLVDQYYIGYNPIFDCPPYGPTGGMRR